MSTIWDVLDQYQERHPTVPWGQMHEQLLAREDGIADILRLAGAQFGLYPEIVAEVLAEAGVGTVPSGEERALIRAQFIELMEKLREQHGNNE